MLALDLVARKVVGDQIWLFGNASSADTARQELRFGQVTLS